MPLTLDHVSTPNGQRNVRIHRNANDFASSGRDPTGRVCKVRGEEHRLVRCGVWGGGRQSDTICLAPRWAGCVRALTLLALAAMRRFLRRKSAQTEPPDREPELPCIVEAVQKLAAEMDGAQDILGKLKQACEDEERQKGASPPAVPPPPVEPKPPAFRVGQHVMVTGLHTATEHNGKVGKIESFRCEAQSARGVSRS